MATQIANLSVKLTATAGAFAATMGKAAGHVKGLGSSLASVGGKIIGFGGALTALAAGGSLAYLVKQSMESIDATAKLSDRLGIATESLVGLQHAADLSGVSAESLTGGLEKMLKTIGDAASEGGAGAAALDKLGLSADALANMPTDQAFGEIAQGLSEIQNPAERARVAMDIFGKSGQQLLPMMLQGREGIAAAMEEAQKLGLTFSRVDAAKVEAANDAMTRLQKVFIGAAQTLAIQLAPFIEVAATKLTELATSGEGMGGKVLSAFEAVVKGIAYASDYLSLLKAGFKLLQAGATYSIFGIVKAIDWIGGGLAKLLSMLPGVSVQWTNFTGDLADGLLEEARQLQAEAGQAFDSFNQGANSKAVGRFFDDVRAKAQASAEAIAANSAKLNGAAFDAEDFADKLKDAEANAKKVADTIADLQKEMAHVGMSDAQRKLDDLAALGATPDQLAKAKELLALKDELASIDKLDTGDDLTTFAARMEQLQKLYAQGRLTAEQFGMLRDSAKATLNDKLAEQARSITESVKSPLEQYREEIERLNVLLEKGLITRETFDRAKLKAQSALEGSKDVGQPVSVTAFKAGGAEAMAAAFQNTRGVQRMTKDDLAKKQLDEQKDMNRSLERIARNTEKGAAQLEVVDF